MNIKKICALVAAFLLGAGIMVVGIGSIELGSSAQATMPDSFVEVTKPGGRFRTYEHANKPITCVRTSASIGHTTCFYDPSRVK